MMERVTVTMKNEMHCAAHRTNRHFKASREDFTNFLLSQLLEHFFSVETRQPGISNPTFLLNFFLSDVSCS